MKFYVLRHGQTELNVKDLINGHLPDKLTAVGREQAMLASESLPKSIKHIYSSPLTRAKQTAEILNTRLAVPITYHDELKEVSFGNLDGTPFLEEHKIRHVNLDYDWTPSGENFEQVKKRVVHFLTILSKSIGEGEALLVVHGGIVRMLTYLETGEKRGEIGNAALFEFDLDKILANAK
ncbi:MAG: histidine phosphatase family protein [Candidatus Saccharimonadales bacterium]